MGKQRQWISPLVKQSFVTAGVSMNMAAGGLVMGFTTGLLRQLQTESSPIPLDDSSGSWIAAIPGLSLILGNLIVPPIMSNYGRKTANLASILPLIIGWALLVFANSFAMLLLARFFQGISMGMCTSLGAMLIGEYTSPRNRGAFLMTISLNIAIAVLIAHSLGSYLHWQMGALVCGVIALFDLAIVACSPESPSWLADQGRYDEAKKIFRWLRGDVEEDELKKMIEASIILKEAKEEANIPSSFVKRIRSNIVYFNTTITKKEFYKPIFIMMNIYTIAQWSGVNFMVAYASDLFPRIVGTDVNIPLMILSIDVHRIFANILAVIIIKRVKRRTMYFTTVAINVFAFIATAAYTYFKDRLSFDHPAIGLILIHIMMFAVATGTLSLCFIIAGEIFPLEYRSLAGGISVALYSCHLFIAVKTTPYFFNTLGIHGTYLLYGALVSACAIVPWFYLPETKDRTLQDIEDELRGRPLTVEELKSVQSLTSWKLKSNMDRRCSTPMIH